MGGLGAEVRDTLKPSQGSQTGKEIPVSAISTAQPPAHGSDHTPWRSDQERRIHYLALWPQWPDGWQFPPLEFDTSRRPVHLTQACSRSR
jgi:hypothetical protein